jgi:replicative DNA helicase
MTSLEEIILHNLIKNDSYSRKVLPFIQREYFINKPERLIFETVQEYITKYGNLPTKEALIIILDKNKGLSEKENQQILQTLDEVCKNTDASDLDWLVSETENFCKEKAVYNAIMESINIIDGKSQNTKGAIPDILSKALAISFDPNIGHDYIEDYSKRYDFYHIIEKKIPFDLEYFNSITKEGVTPKTLNVVMAGTGVGKSLFLCHHAAYCLKNNMNVLYITCEMAEEKIAERIDANLLDTNLDDLRDMSKTIYEKKIQAISSASTGKLIIKEYPTGTPNANHFRFLLDELKLKKKFKPDVIFVDYLNICASSRIKKGKENSYEYVKAIAEEIRGLAIEYNLPIFTATQTNRSGYGNTDVDLENTSESFGLPATCDFMFALISTDELDELNQILVKQLKNRYNDKAKNRKFIVGIDRGKMKLFDVKKEDQAIINSGEKKIQEFFEPKTKKKKEVDGWDNSKKNFDSWNI